MKQAVRILILLSAGFLARPVFIPTADGADCVVECMERSGCWSGRSVSDPGSCNNMPQLCQIQCKGKSGTGWGAIAYSPKEKASGWSAEQDFKGTAAQVAMQYCAQDHGSACAVQVSFFNSCGAVAADGNTIGTGTASTKATAEQTAMAVCARSGGKKCEVEESACSGAGGGSNTSSTTPRAPAAPKAIAWGAIAYSARDMGAGWSQGKADRASAEKEAMSVCSQRGKDCVLRTAFNKQCGALAADGAFAGWGSSTDQRAAQLKAVDDCKKAGGARCVLHISFCSE